MGFVNGFRDPKNLEKWPSSFSEGILYPRLYALNCAYQFSNKNGSECRNLNILIILLLALPQSI